MSDEIKPASRLEIWIPVLCLLIGGVLSYGTLKSDVEHKAESKDVAVIQTQLDNIADDVSENKESIKELRDTVEKNNIILNSIAIRVGADPN